MKTLPFAEAGMHHILGNDRAQSLLLPASVEEYVGEDNPVRAIEAFVDGFDLAKAGFVRAEAKVTGPSGRSAQALPLRLLEPGAFLAPFGSGVPPQPGSHLALTWAAA